jgi:hypothetical protein
MGTTIEEAKGITHQERPVEEESCERLKLGYDLLSEDDWRLEQYFQYFAAFPEDEGDFLRFKVHDVMRDLAFYILEKDYGTPPAKQLYFYRAGQNLEAIPKECTSMENSHGRYVAKFDGFPVSHEK